MSGWVDLLRHSGEEKVKILLGSICPWVRINFSWTHDKLFSSKVHIKQDSWESSTTYRIRASVISYTMPKFRVSQSLAGLVQKNHHLLWVHECDSDDTYRRQNVTALLPILQHLHSFRLSSSMFPEPWRGEEDLSRFPFSSNQTLSLLFSVPRTVVHLPIDCRPGQRDVSMTKNQNGSGLWLQTPIFKSYFDIMTV